FGFYLNFSFAKSTYKLVIKVVILGYGVGLIVGSLLFFVLPFAAMFKYTVLLGLLLPVSVSDLPYSVELGGVSQFVATVSNIMIIISFVLLWLITNLII